MKKICFNLSFLQQAFTKESKRIHADSRNSKEIQGFMNTLDFLESPWFVRFSGKSLQKERQVEIT